jgi:hypothetical protein
MGLYRSFAAGNHEASGMVQYGNVGYVWGGRFTTGIGELTPIIT